VFVVCSGVGRAIVEKGRSERERIAGREKCMLCGVRGSVRRSDGGEDAGGDGTRDGNAFRTVLLI
jgi:hypothetical protein